MTSNDPVNERIARHDAWAWCAASGDLPNQYVEWIHPFQLGDERRGLRLCISADTNFAVWCNERYVGSGQYSDWPDRKTYTEFEIDADVLRGRNTLCILGYYCGADTYGYLKGEPRLWYVLGDHHKILACSGPESRCRISPSYKQGSMPRRSNQLGFVFEYDARRDDGWRTPDYQPDNTWQPPAIRRERAPAARPIPPLVLGDAPVGTILAQGVFRREFTADSVAELMQFDLLSARRSYEVFESPPPPEELVALPAVIREDAFALDGVYAVIDLGQEWCGYIELELSAEAGVVIDVAVGEHVADLRVRAAIRGRHFASRYICRGGRQMFTHWIDRYAGRYMQLHITQCRRAVRLERASLRPADYPVVARGVFCSSDTLLNKIVEISNRTVHLCMHEHYEDCPWREQAIYAADAHNQALTGYYAFGEYGFPRASWDLLRHGLRNDGWLEMCAPAHIGLTIPCLTLIWVRNLGNYLRYAGDTSLMVGCHDQVLAILDRLIGSLHNDLLPCPTGPGVWHFYDWVHGLDGRGVTRQKHRGLSGERYDAPLNLFLVSALQTAAEIVRALGKESDARRYTDIANRMSVAIDRAFWRESDTAYQTYLGDELPCDSHFAEQTQALAILTRTCPEKRAIALCERLVDNGNNLVKSSLSQSYYKYEAILATRHELATSVFKQICARWSSMLFAGATTFWETEQGERDFMHGGSLCHGWSGIPTYFTYAYLLGVKPATPGFATFSFCPLSAGFDRASGRIPTPHGEIEVAWRRQGDVITGQLSHPSATRPVFHPSIERDNWDVRPM